MKEGSQGERCSFEQSFYYIPLQGIISSFLLMVSGQVALKARSILPVNLIGAKAREKNHKV